MTQIGFVTYGLNRALGGIGRYTEELLLALQASGTSLLQLQAGDHELPGTAVRLKGSKLLPGLLTLGQAEISWFARQHKLDVVHDPTGSMPLFLTGQPKVATIHDVVPYIYPETSSRLDWLIYRIWLPLAVRRLDAIITDSEQSKRDIVQYLPVPQEKVTVIPCAVNANYKPLNESEIQPAL
ncbi:MAG: glycosyltransferase, partial [Chloroflexota bacterium]